MARRRPDGRTPRCRLIRRPCSSTWAFRVAGTTRNPTIIGASNPASGLVAPSFDHVAELAESYDPSDDDEVAGQDALWEPPVVEPVVQQPHAATPQPNARPVTPRPNTPRPTTSRVSVSSAGRGVTGRGVVVLVTAFTALVGIADVIASGHRGHLFGIAFALATAAGAYLVRRRDLLIAVVAPPLIYCALIVFMSLIDTDGTTGSLTTRIGVYIGDAFATGAPSIWAGTAAAGVVVWWRTGGTIRRLPPALATWKRNRKRA
jgi:hypothetical protein